VKENEEEDMDGRRRIHQTTRRPTFPGCHVILPGFLNHFVGCSFAPTTATLFASLFGFYFSSPATHIYASSFFLPHTVMYL